MRIETEKIITEILNLKTTVSRLSELSDDLPALNRNLQRIAASVKMLELNFIDPDTYANPR